MFNKLIASRARRPSATPRRSFESSDSLLNVDMGKRNDSIEFVTLLDVLNEAGLSERQVHISCFAQNLASYIENTVSNNTAFSTCNSESSGATLAPAIFGLHAEKWTSSFSLMTFMSLSTQFVEFGVLQALTLTKLLVGEFPWWLWVLHRYVSYSFVLFVLTLAAQESDDWLNSSLRIRARTSHN